MTRHTLTNHRAVEHVEGGKQRCRAMPLVVVGHGAATTFLHGQTRLRSFQCLNLAFFINAQHQGFIGRIQVQAHNIVEFFNKPLIFGKFERAGAMWLQSICIPDPMDRGRTDAMQLRHRPHTPMGRRFGSRMQSSFHDFLNLGRCNLFRATAARRIINQHMRSAGAVGRKLYETGREDELIDEWLTAKVAPQLDTSQCPDCHGTGMYYPEGLGRGGVKKCDHKRLTEALSPNS